MKALPVRDETQVAEARRGAVALARTAGFNEEAAGRVASGVTELGTNLGKHGSGGEILAGAYEDPTGSGLECIALDRGKGMADVDLCLRDGYSTAGSPGTGLGAVVRQSQTVEIFSRPGQGTAVLARLQAVRPASIPGPTPPWAGLCLPKSGEIACGDSWCAELHPDGLTLLVADGLGHGPLAAEAAQEAVRVFRKHHLRPPAETVELMHAGLRATRGAAVAVARVDMSHDKVLFAGIGNIAGTMMAGSETRKMVSHNGTAGHTAKRIQEFAYGFSGIPLVVLSSDGLGTSWTLDRYPGLGVRHPALIAAVLYRDFTRGRDDVTVLAARGSR